MKTKNLLFALAAILVAVAGAFASITTQAGKYINVRYQGQANFTCTPINACNSTSGATCFVNIDGFTPQVYANRASATLCTQPHANADAVIITVDKPLTVVQVQ